MPEQPLHRLSGGPPPHELRTQGDKMREENSLTII